MHADIQVLSRETSAKIINYLVWVRKQTRMPQYDAQSQHAQATDHSPAASLALLQKSTSTLQQELATLGGGGQNRSLKTKCGKLQLAYTDLCRDHKSLSDTVTQLQAHLEDLDNRIRRNNSAQVPHLNICACPPPGKGERGKFLLCTATSMGGVSQ